MPNLMHQQKEENKQRKCVVHLKIQCWFGPCGNAVTPCAVSVRLSSFWTDSTFLVYISISSSLLLANTAMTIIDTLCLLLCFGTQVKSRGDGLFRQLAPLPPPFEWCFSTVSLVRYMHAVIFHYGYLCAIWRKVDQFNPIWDLSIMQKSALCVCLRPNLEN